MPNNTFRVVTRGKDGSIRIRDYDNHEPLLKMHTQVGIDDSSTDLALRGLPVFRGLIGPMPEEKGVVRYETPDVFESLTKEWAVAKTPRRTRRRTQKPTSIKHVDTVSQPHRSDGA
ncbi:MAG TPA: hypothetical protein QF564_16480 [Pirellulaceae bacterium]|mgnify:CR=1 FL=1|jgi:hypothetical protein|nr:hypothetical protein [Pirellulaceae bacterium]